MKKKLVAVLAASLLSFQAFADVDVSLLFGKAEQGFQTTNSALALANSPEFNEDDSSIGLRLSFPIGKNFGIDIAYQDFGKTETSFVDGFNDTINDTSEVKGFSAGVKGAIFLTDNFSLIGRLGLMRWDHELRRVDSGIGTSTASAKGSDAYYGVGAQYNFTDAFSVGLEYSTFSFDYVANTTTIDNDIENVSLSLGYRF